MSRLDLLMRYLPWYYDNSYEMKELMSTEGLEFDALFTASESVFDQHFVESATWGLDRWESELAIPTNPQKPYAERRSVIISKLRGTGTVTVAQIKNVAEAFDGGTVDVVEKLDEYKFYIKFIDTRGIPSNLNDLKKLIDDIKPAHLSVEYLFTYFIWNELDYMRWTWDALDEIRLTWDQIEVFRGTSIPETGIPLRGVE
ncbi:YmfQ family protein [Paenibacillus hamazuiensis]|uniref:YmfQ family protein n=1 Tax=Paenibacillus hamazuiensis TaxID=2936508 RepID=UPI00200F660A|nr:YmfQ family protein [Paenibacillus hamazuiensis]